MAGEQDTRYAASNPEAAPPTAGPAPSELSPVESVEHERAVMVLLRQSSPLGKLIASLGLLSAIQGAAIVQWSGRPRLVSGVLPTKTPPP